MRKCKECGEEKSLEEFSKSNSSSSGRRYKCRKCSANYYKQYCQTHKEELARKKALYRKENKQKIFEKF